MLNLEGTRHERAVVVGVSYVIGFVTAAIGFGVGGQYVNAPTPITLATAPTVPVTPPPSERSFAETAPTYAGGQAAAVSAVYEAGKLVVATPEHEVVLSVSAEAADDAAEVALGSQGIHTALAAHSLSPDAAHVFFCESLADPAYCIPYVYAVTEGLIHYVNNGTEPIEVPTSDAIGHGWSDAGLSLGEYVSIDPAQPWRVSTR